MEPPLPADAPAAPADPRARPAVTMFVYNDVTHDNRVFRGAASLVSAGYDVTVMGRRRRWETHLPVREARDGFTIVRVEPPIGAAWQGTWLPAEAGAVYTDLFTGAEVRAGDPPADAGTQEGSALLLERVFADFPLALLARDIAS